jgi:hypothetical protein
MVVIRGHFPNVFERFCDCICVNGSTGSRGSCHRSAVRNTPNHECDQLRARATRQGNVRAVGSGHGIGSQAAVLFHRPDQISIRLNRERRGVALHLSTERRGERHPLNVIANRHCHWGSCANLEIRSRASGEPRSLALSYQVRASAASGMILSRSRNPPSTRGS